MCLRAAALMAITFGMTNSQFTAWRRVVGRFLVNERFGMSARQKENGFVQGRIVSSRRPRRNIRGENKNDFNKRKIGGFQRRKSSAALTTSSSRRTQGGITTGRCCLVR